MIVNSTPGSITWRNDSGHQIIFSGEWTLEPKFYLYLSVTVFWSGTHPRSAVTQAELDEALKSLLLDASAKGWVIQIE